MPADRRSARPKGGPASPLNPLCCCTSPQMPTISLISLPDFRWRPSASPWKYFLAKLSLTTTTCALSASIGIAKGAAGDHGDAHGLEVGRRGIDELAAVRIVVVAIHRAKAVIQRALVRQRQRHRGGLHSGNAPHALQGLRVEPVDRCRGLVARILQRRLGGDHVVRVEARIEAVEPGQRAHHQAGADQQHQAERHLGGHQRAACPTAASHPRCRGRPR